MKCFKDEYEVQKCMISDTDTDRQHWFGAFYRRAVAILIYHRSLHRYSC